MVSQAGLLGSVTETTVEPAKGEEAYVWTH